MKKLIAVGLSLLVLFSCAMANPQIVCSFYPVWIFAQNMLDGVDASVTSLTPPTTGCLHDYQLLTSDLRALSRADALIVNGAGMESFLSDVCAQLPDLPVIDCSQGVSLISDEHGVNAHIWLNPRNAQIMVDNMARGLAEVLPDDKDAIARNAARYMETLDQLDAALREGIAALPRRDIVTFHEAFPYFAEGYGLSVLASVTLDPDESPSPAYLAQVIKKIRENGGCALFTEPDVSSDALKTIAQETGAPVYTLFPVTSGTGAKDDYETQMRENLQILEQALN